VPKAQPPQPPTHHPPSLQAKRSNLRLLITHNS
jgi:hypothetical protein